MSEQAPTAATTAATGTRQPRRRNPWAWIPSLYWAEGIPYVVVNTVSVIMYKKMGISNTDIALYTSLLYLPWGFKGLWSPFVDMYRTKRFWILSMQLLFVGLFASVAFGITLPMFFPLTLAIFWVTAFASATHDIAADGFYMLGLEPHEQAAFVGIRNTFYRIAMLTGTGVLVVVAGQMEIRTGGQIASAWSTTFGVTALLVGIVFVYHRFMLPYPAADRPVFQEQGKGPLAGFVGVFGKFFSKEGIWVSVAFLMLYRFPEAQLIKLVSPFLLDPIQKGGLGLSTSDVGLVYGTVGMIALLLGGLLGGYLISRNGLKFWLWPMVIIMHLPDLAFVYLSQAQPNNFTMISAAVALEQFGYGFGFTAYTMYMIQIAEGDHKTAYYAICTGFMAFGMLIPGMFSGALQELLGYGNFFLWVIISTIPGFVVTALVKVKPGFGKKENREK
jgi:MFS transporter, PAT family, beta-lactamase induction signal transducer AmpG